jgi:hypothetical protein
MTDAQRLLFFSGVLSHLRLTRQQDAITALLGLNILSLSGGFNFADG